MKKVWIGMMAVIAALALSGCGSSDSDKTKVGMKYLASQVESGSTAENASARILVVDTRSSSDYIQGHIKDALNVPYAMIVSDGKPLYTNGYDAISITASDKLADSWLAHMLINQLVNDFFSTYEDSTLVFYGDNGCKAKDAAISVGYENAVCLDATYDAWESAHPDLTAKYGPGVESVDKENHSFVFTGFINTTNYANVSIRATHHGITYKGGCLSASSFLQADLPPFCFQEIMTYIGISSAGNMADGIVYRSEERRVGKECRRLCRSRWSPYH
jgi:rhodanese-related sulfurtransferase